MLLETSGVPLFTEQGEFVGFKWIEGLKIRAKMPFQEPGLATVARREWHADFCEVLNGLLFCFRQAEPGMGVIC